MAPTPVPFWDRTRDEGDCTVWTGSKSRGYGRVRRDGKICYAHRVAYEIVIGAIPEGMDVMHSCDNPACVNPGHLSLGTHAENMADMKARGRAGRWNSRKTHCKRGHEFTRENTYRPASGGRQCRICRRALFAGWWSEHRTSDKPLKRRNRQWVHQ